jgi:hypothetical protein
LENIFITFFLLKRFPIIMPFSMWLWLKFMCNSRFYLGNLKAGRAGTPPPPRRGVMQYIIPGASSAVHWRSNCTAEDCAGMALHLEQRDRKIETRP